MNKTLRLSLLGISVGVAFLAGCELIVDFDRTQIPADVTDSSTPPRDALVADTTAPDASTDAADTGTDATTDAPATDASDAGSDAAADASNDAADAAD